VACKLFAALCTDYTEITVSHSESYSKSGIICPGPRQRQRKGSRLEPMCRFTSRRRTVRQGLRGKGKSRLVAAYDKSHRHPFSSPCRRMSAWHLKNRRMSLATGARLRWNKSCRAPSMVRTHETSTPLTHLYWTNILARVKVQDVSIQRLTMMTKSRTLLHSTYGFLI
jgi:hypothetical protein